MKTPILMLAILVSLLSSLTIPNFAFGLFAADSPKDDNWLIKGIYSNSPDTGFAFTRSMLLATRDGGKTWRQLDLPLGRSDEIAGATANGDNVVVLIADPSTSSLSVAAADGRNFSKAALSIAPGVLDEAELSNAKFTAKADGTFNIELRLTTSSNFAGKLLLTASLDGTASVADRSVELNHDTAAESVTSGGWSLVSDGTCAGYKAGCMQESRILSNGQDITPPQIKQAAAAEKARLQAETLNSPLLSPGGSTRVSLNRGFDMCNAPTAAQMQTWWNNSPLYDMNIYMSGRNRACRTQPNLSAAWVDQVAVMGWGLFPTVVGYQSPCTASTTTAKLDYNPTTAEQQGRGEADIAVADAANLGLTAGSILYYDMERYDPPTPDTLGCRAATIAFLKGWTDRIKELGYKSGTYGSPKNAQEDWVNLPAASKMDAIWMARWDNIPSVWTYLTFPNFPTNEWANHQRIKQWQAPHNETWGGVTFNIDGNISDSLVAGPAIARNKNADFDGDGKTDISVFRPDSGVWYLRYSSTSGFTGIPFGNGADIVAPADFDGDGKTDTAVFRPSDGTWHVLTKAGFYSVRQFGATGDLPVAADYNGDGKADTAVWRPANGVWYISNSDSQGTYTFVQFGAEGDKPVPADYDGDGKTDPAVYRPSTGVWYVLRSSDGNFKATSFGLSADLPAEGDFDGDGKCDFAVYRDGVWYLMQSTAGFSAFQFGVAGDVPSTGDYDGDGKVGPAIFRPSQGAWYVLGSTAGVSVVSFGLAGDRSIPAAYLPQ